MDTISIEIDSLIKKSKETVEKRKDLISYEEFRLLDINIYKTKGVVYFIYIQSGNEFSLKYIGKSRGGLFKQRIRNHFHSKHQKTGSKLNEITKEIKKGNLVRLNFITTDPESLRNLVEEELIKIYKKKLWNR